MIHALCRRAAFDIGTPALATGLVLHGTQLAQSSKFIEHDTPSHSWSAFLGLAFLTSPLADLPRFADTLFSLCLTVYPTACLGVPSETSPSSGQTLYSSILELWLDVMYRLDTPMQGWRRRNEPKIVETITVSEGVWQPKDGWHWFVCV